MSSTPTPITPRSSAAPDPSERRLVPLRTLIKVDDSITSVIVPMEVKSGYDVGDTILFIAYSGLGTVTGTKCQCSVPSDRLVVPIFGVMPKWGGEDPMRILHGLEKSGLTETAVCAGCVPVDIFLQVKTDRSPVPIGRPLALPINVAGMMPSMDSLVSKYLDMIKVGSPLPCSWREDLACVATVHTCAAVGAASNAIEDALKVQQEKRTRVDIDASEESQA